MLKRAAKQLLAWAGLELRRRPATDPIERDPGFEEIFARARTHTLCSKDSLHAFYRAVGYVVRRRLPGAIVECGVWQGGASMVALHALRTLKVTDRDVYLYDTFERMPTPTEADVDHRGRRASDLYAQKSPGSWWWGAPLDGVRKNLAELAYPAPRLHIVQGRVEDTIPSICPDVIAVLRLDLDFYEATRHTMTQLFPRLCPGGVLIINDYGHWRGARRAVDEYLDAVNTPLYLHIVDYSERLAIKV